MKTLEDLKEELQNLRKEYKNSKKQMKQMHQENLRLLKKQYKENVREVYVEAAKNNLSPTLFDKFVKATDLATMTLCKPFKDKFELLEYKQANPKGYDADEAVREIRQLTNYFKKKVQKGKELSKKDFEVIAQFKISLYIINKEQVGRLWKEAKSLSSEIDELITTPEMEESAAKMINLFDDMIEGFNTQTERQ